MRGIKIAVFTREVNEHTELLSMHGVNIVIGRLFLEVTSLEKA